MIGRKRDDTDLTDDEKAFLRSGQVNPLVKQFTARALDGIGVRTSAYEKIAAAARAERRALESIRLLEEARNGDLPMSAQRMADLEAEVHELAQTNAELRTRLNQMTALPARAVHSND